MLHIAIIEDEETWQQFAIREIRTYYKEKERPEIDCFQTGEAFLQADRKYDILFMDIELPGEDGFAISEKYTGRHGDVILIIMTTHTEMSRKGYLVNAFRYVDKFHPEEMEEALRSAEKKQRQWKLLSLPVPRHGEVKVRCRDILYFESVDHNLKIKTVTDLFVLRDKLEVFASKLEGLGFFQTHRSFLVNLDHVIDFSTRDIHMSDGKTIPVSRKRYKEFQEAYFQWKFENANG